MSMRVWERFVSLAALSIIIGGSSLAWNHEHAESNLQRWYDRDNKTFFDGKLPSVSIHFGDLNECDADGETKFRNAVAVEIIIDRDSSDQRVVVRHEMCHIHVGDPDHGIQFQNCMLRFTR